MGVKPARQSYTRDEITDILRRNAALYKDEEGFIEFFTELALYLLQQQVDNPGRLQPWPEPAPLESREAPSPIGLSSSHEAPAPIAEDEGDGQMVLPPTVAQLKQRTSQDPGQSRSTSPPPYQGTAGVPPPPPPPSPRQSEDWEMPASSGLYPVGQQEGDGDPQRSRRSQSRQNIEVDRVSLTPYASDSRSTKKPSGESLKKPAPEPPPPADPPSEEFRKSGEDKKGFVQRNIGKAKVYKVSRSYRSSTSAEVPCHVCGSMISLGAKHCPSCGTPVSN